MQVTQIIKFCPTKVGKIAVSPCIDALRQSNNKIKVVIFQDLSLLPQSSEMHQILKNLPRPYIFFVKILWRKNLGKLHVNKFLLAVYELSYLLPALVVSMPKLRPGAEGADWKSEHAQVR